MEQNKIELVLNSTILESNNLSQEKQSQIPEGAIYFRAVASSDDLNRNGYIIEPLAWGKYISDFLTTGKILWQHNETQPIGKPLSVYIENNQLIVEGFVFDDIYSNGLIKRKIVDTVSTGHITHSAEYRHPDGRVVDDNEFWNLGISDIMDDKWVLHITEAELCELSFVSIPSNKKALVQVNRLEEYNKRNKSIMNLQKNSPEVEAVADATEIEAIQNPETQTEVAPQEPPTEGQEGGGIKVEVGSELEVLKAEIEALKAEIEANKTTIQKMQEDTETNRDHFAKIVLTQNAKKSLKDLF